jgi:hypothetical protein
MEAAGYRDYTIEVFYKGEPVHLIDLTENSTENACRRSINAVFMAALRDGREYPLDSITAREYGTDGEPKGRDEL